MESLTKYENSLFSRFNKIIESKSIAETKKLYKDIQIYFDSISNPRIKPDPIMLDLSIILELNLMETKNSALEDIFDYNSKIKKTYEIAESIVTKFQNFNLDNFNLHYLAISQFLLSYVKTIEEAEKLYQKFLEALNYHLKDDPRYIKIKFNYNFTMIERALKADFFEVDHINEKERSKLVEDIYEYHLGEAFKICKSSDEFGEKYEIWLKIRDSIMKKDSEEVTKNLEAAKKITYAKKFNDRISEEIGYYSFHPKFELTRKQFNISLGIRIRKIREMNLIRPSEFSYRLGYSYNRSLVQIEKGDVDIEFSQLEKIAEFFGLKVEELCHGLSIKNK